LIPLAEQIAAELNVRPAQVQSAIDLLDGGATVPFIARYRKEATAGLDDVQLRALEVRLAYLRELAQRRETVLRSIEEQGKLTPALRAAIDAAESKQALEDLYAPYKPKRRTKGMIAREAGLEPLADRLFSDPGLDPATESENWLGALDPSAREAVEALGFKDALAVQDGVRDLLSERWAEDAALVGPLREWLWSDGLLRSRLAAGKSGQDVESAKFRDYFDHAEPIGRVPSHRALAMFRGRAQQVLDLTLLPPDVAEAEAAQAAQASQVAPDPAAPAAGAGPARAPRAAARPGPSLAEGRIARHLGWSDARRPGDAFIRRCIAWTWKVKLALSLERDLFARLREAAEAVAIQVFADNLRDLLLAAPAGAEVVMGVDPGIRTGCKVAVVDATGKVLETATVYPHEPRNDWSGALATLGTLVARHRVRLVAVGNGTASRETDRLVGELIRTIHGADSAYRIQKLVVSEAGASVYSASETASRELPDLDVSLRGAVSIARRLQDPLAELVKIDPKSIGVGQYQHDVNQGELARTLDAVVEDCVNKVGVDLNTASPPLLARVAGLSPGIASAVVRWRDAHGAFRNRQQLLEVSGLGPRTFEQAAGFLRIRDGEQPLDASGVHPETYPVVEALLATARKPLSEVMGRADVLRGLRPQAIADTLGDPRFGAITVQDILTELEKPGRDPRGDFKVVRFNEGVEDIADLRPGMLLEGTVSNVAQFGAFVDLGVHQDGLVHVSQLASRFVKDAREVVKTGDIVKVRVLGVDLPRKRIALSMKLDGAPAARDAPGELRFRPAGKGEVVRRGGGGRSVQPAGQGAMAAAFAKLQSGRR
jgi:uncharacterized protein